MLSEAYVYFVRAQIEKALGRFCLYIARKHLCYPGMDLDPCEMHKLQLVEKHIAKCGDVRRIRDWESVVREVDAAIAAGADSSPQEPLTISSSQAKFFGMLSEAYVYFVRAQIEKALGRFENAVKAAEKASQMDPRNVEVAVLVNNVRMVARARVRGNDLFKSERFTEACSAYGDGLRLDPSNSVLYCNRAACWFKLGQWERSIEDSNHALKIQPNYTKALLRRAASNSKDFGVLMIPTVPGSPPKLQTDPSELEVFRARAFSLLSIAGVSGFCQDFALVECMV
ncbi:hypothetical protein AHAS_Ahas06G0071600 [Arachis hypogaea]